MSNPVNRTHIPKKKGQGRGRPKKPRPREWMPVKGYFGYLRDSNGRVMNRETGHILPVITREGKKLREPYVRLWKDGVIVEAEVSTLKDDKL